MSDGISHALTGADGCTDAPSPSLAGRLVPSAVDNDAARRHKQMRVPVGVTFTRACMATATVLTSVTIVHFAAAADPRAHY